MKEYTDKATVENYLNKDIDDSFNAQIDEWIDAMSIQADTIANRVLVATEEETFVYDGDGSNLLVIKDCVDITSVTVDGIEREVFTYPTNKPYTSRIRLPDGYRFTKGIQNVEVTAKHGMHKEVPSDVKFAVTVLVAGIFRNQDNESKDGTSERIGNYTITYHTKEEKADIEKAKKILSGYRRIAL